MSPEPVEIYRASKLKILGLLALFLFFLGGGIWMARAQDATSTDHAMGILCIVIFGGLSILMIRQLLPGRASFEAKPEGLTIRSAFQTITYRWSDIENFGVMEFTVLTNGTIPDIVKGRVEGKRHFRRVGFNFSGSYAGGGLAWRNREYNQKHYGFDGFLPDNYQTDCAQLAAHLNDLKKQHGG